MHTDRTAPDVNRHSASQVSFLFQRSVVGLAGGPTLSMTAGSPRRHWVSQLFTSGGFIACCRHN